MNAKTNLLSIYSLSVLFFAVAFLLQSCLNQGGSRSTNVLNNTPQKKPITVNAHDDVFELSGNTGNTTHSTTVTVGEGTSFRYSLTVGQQINVLGMLKHKKDSFYDFAYLLAQNEGKINLHISIPYELDTTVTCYVSLPENFSHHSSITQGKCAKLTGAYDATNVESDIIRWLYRKGGNGGDMYVDSMRRYLQELNKTEYQEFTTTEDIPIVASLQGISYKVSSDLKADHYYLYACRTEEEIDAFVEEMVSRKYPGAYNSLTQNMKCIKSETYSGTLCIFLVGINNDWSHTVTPLGLICVDDIKPSTSMIASPYQKERPAILLANSKIKVNEPTDVPTGMGFADLKTRDFGGNGVSCQVNFSVVFSGDVKSLTLVRSGNLSQWLSRANKVIDLQKETSPYFFTYELHLEEGDNYVPIIITDLRDNTTEYQMNIPAHFTRSESPAVNIENNIYN